MVPGSGEEQAIGPTRPFRWKRIAWGLFALLLASLVVSWRIQSVLNWEPIPIRWVISSAGELLPTPTQWWVGVVSALVGTASAVALGAMALGAALRKRSVFAAGAWIPVVTVVGVAFVGRPIWPRWYEQAERGYAPIGRTRHIRGAMDDLRKLVLVYHELRMEGDPALERLSGKDVLLRLVTAGYIDRRNPLNFRVLFPPGLAASQPAPEAYDALTPETLGRSDLGHLTGYLGPDRPPLLTPYEGEPFPVFGDVSSGEVAVVAFSDGLVRPLRPEQLGMEPGAPLLVGEDSPSPILRRLSAHSGSRRTEGDPPTRTEADR